eukprot:754643-Hanusia_phi.AAC.1
MKTWLSSTKNICFGPASPDILQRRQAQKCASYRDAPSTPVVPLSGYKEGSRLVSRALNEATLTLSNTSSSETQASTTTLVTRMYRLNLTRVLCDGIAVVRESMVKPSCLLYMKRSIEPHCAFLMQIKYHCKQYL